MNSTQKFILELIDRGIQLVNAHGFIALVTAFGFGLHIPNTIIPYMRKKDDKDAA